MLDLPLAVALKFDNTGCILALHSFLSVSSFMTEGCVKNEKIFGITVDFEVFVLYFIPMKHI